MVQHLAARRLHAVSRHLLYPARPASSAAADVGAETDTAEKTFTLAEVAEHRSRRSAWVALHGEVNPSPPTPHTHTRTRTHAHTHAHCIPTPLVLPPRWPRGPMLFKAPPVQGSVNTVLLSLVTPLPYHCLSCCHLLFSTVSTLHCFYSPRCAAVLSLPPSTMRRWLTCAPALYSAMLHDCIAASGLRLHRVP